MTALHRWPRLPLSLSLTRSRSPLAQQLTTCSFSLSRPHFRVTICYVWPRPLVPSVSPCVHRPFCISVTSLICLVSSFLSLFNFSVFGSLLLSRVLFPVVNAPFYAAVRPISPYPFFPSLFFPSRRFRLGPLGLSSFRISVGPDFAAAAAACCVSCRSLYRPHPSPHRSLVSASPSPFHCFPAFDPWPKTLASILMNYKMSCPNVFFSFFQKSKIDFYWKVIDDHFQPRYSSILT